MYNEHYLKAKIKPHNAKINTNSHNNKMPKEDSKFVCLSAILVDSVFSTGKNYYPQVFAEECKYVVKEKKMPEYITNNMMILTEKILMKKLPMEKIIMKKIKYRMCFCITFRVMLSFS